MPSIAISAFEIAQRSTGNRTTKRYRNAHNLSVSDQGPRIVGELTSYKPILHTYICIYVYKGRRGTSGGLTVPNSPEISSLATAPRVSTSGRVPCLVTTSFRFGIVAPESTVKNVRRDVFRSTKQRVAKQRSHPFRERWNVIATRGSSPEKQANTVELFLPEFLAVSRILPGHLRILRPPSLYRCFLPLWISPRSMFTIM